jgi:hypothetical protein
MFVNLPDAGQGNIPLTFYPAQKKRQPDGCLKIGSETPNGYAVFFFPASRRSMRKKR